MQKKKLDSYIFYKTICLKNDKYYYGVHKVIGSVEEDQYLGSGVDLQKDIELYGRDQFVRSIIMHSYDKELVDLAEAHYVRQKELHDIMCYNKKLGGDDMNNQSDIFKERLEREKFLLRNKESRLKLGQATTNIVDYISKEKDDVLVYVSKKKSNELVNNAIRYNSPKLSREENDREFNRIELNRTNKEIKLIDKEIENMMNIKNRLINLKDSLEEKLHL